MESQHNFSLEKILFDPQLQRGFLSVVLKVMKKTSTEQECIPPLLGTTADFDNELMAPRKKKTKPVHVTTSSLVAAPCTPSSPSKMFDFPCAHFDWLISNPRASSLQLTWGVLICLYLSDKVKDLVCANTPPSIAELFLRRFDSRFESYMCGVLKHTKATKSSKLERQSKTPTEIVLAEWCFANQLYTNGKNFY